MEVDLLCALVAGLLWLLPIALAWAGSPHVLILALRLAGLSLEFKWLDTKEKRREISFLWNFMCGLYFSLHLVTTRRRRASYKLG